MLFHVAGISFLVQLGLRLAQQVFVPSFDAAQILSLIEAERVAEIFLVPTMIRLLLNEPSPTPRLVRAMPLSVAGKLLKHVLREPCWREPDAAPQ